MASSWKVPLLILALVHSSSSQLSGRTGHGSHKFTDALPPCNYYSGYQTLFCQYLTSDNEAALLEQSLLITSQALPPSTPFNMEIVYSDGAGLPLDLFQGYDIQGLILGYNGFTAVPYELLSSLGPSLTSLAIEDEPGITSLAAPDVQLPFSDSLQILIFGNIAIESIDGGTFNQFINLKQLTFEFSLLHNVDSQFGAPGSLTALTFMYNQLTSISPDVFVNLVNLQSLDLSNNQLQTLQQDAFDGLDSLQTIYLMGNPWNCNCDLQWLKDWLSTRNLLESSGATCALPTQAPFADVNFCPPPTK